MKYFLTAVWTVICVGVLVYGQMYWNQQTAAVQAGNPVPIEESAPEVATYDGTLALAKNWPESAQAQFKQRLEEEQPYKIVFVGSLALEGDWESMITAGLAEAYSSEQLTTAVYTYDGTSQAFIEENWTQELAAEKADLILLEPFLLNDTNEVEIEDTLANITKVMEEVKASHPDTTFLLQPSYPIYQARTYPKQVEALKAFAEENSLPYLDHWTAWPDPDSPEVNDYLQEDGPNEQGYQLWTEFILNYFVKK